MLIKFHAAALLKIVQKSVINSIYPGRIFKLVVASFKLPPLPGRLRDRILTPAVRPLRHIKIADLFS